MAIRFYRVNERYGAFSNFSRHAIVMEGAVWPTAEHHFQAMKYPHDPRRQQRIRDARAPAAAKRIAWEQGTRPREDWSAVRDVVMLGALRAKFAQNEDVRRLLLSTGDEELIEHTRNDSYWGDGGDGSGRNMLGRLLMQVRSELRQGENGRGVG